MYRFSIAIALAAAVLAVQAGAAAAASDCSFALATSVLTGPDGGTLTATVTTDSPGCSAPDTIKKIQVKSGGPARNYKDVAAPGGVAVLDLGPVARGAAVDVQALVQPDRTYVLHGTTKALLRPDLVVSLTAPAQALGGREFAVQARVTERNGDVGATGTLTLSGAGTVLGTADVDVAASGSVEKELRVTLTDPGAVVLEASVGDVTPRETDATNDAARQTVEVTQFQLDSSNVLVPSVAGYGGQFNGRVYAKISRDVGVTDQNVGDLEQKMVALQPQLSRVFIAGVDVTDPDRVASFKRTVLLMQRAGAIINVTWQGGTFTPASGNIKRFADILLDLVRNQGVTNLRWVTLQNEPNSTSLTPAQVDKEYRDLDPLLMPIRGQVKYMGGDLVQTNQRVWFDYMAQHMADILDAWSIHVFWDYWDTGKLQSRLSEVRAIWDGEPEAGRKPLYVMEYGVRGLQTFNGVAQFQPGVWQDGTPMTQTNVNAFQHAWFDILSSRLGYLGTAKWDSYFAKYDNGTQSYYMVGRPQDGWPLYPIYHTVRLWTMSVKPGWKVVGLDGDGGTKLLTAYADGGNVSVVGLDTSGAQLNGVSPEQVSYTIGGLPPSTSFHLAVWNAAGDGQTSVQADVVSDPAGVAIVTAPLQAVFSLTTMPVQAG